ncbi:NADPH oxidase 5 [Dromaius novaehollandiae]|uniref:NADPH oxidase 5 n=1 Tax=Dromaius novaehollandiae TaxID=8790 RepID=UPI00311FB79B
MEAPIAAAGTCRQPRRSPCLASEAQEGGRNPVPPASSPPGLCGGASRAAQPGLGAVRRLRHRCLLLDARGLARVAGRFGSIAGDRGEIGLEQFKAALEVKEAFFAERLFALIDADGSGTLSLEELLKALGTLARGSETDKLRFLFQLYDVDGSGSVDVDELCAVLPGRERPVAAGERLDALTLAPFEAADTDRSGSVTFQELREQLRRFPELVENLSISGFSSRAEMGCSSSLRSAGPSDGAFPQRGWCGPRGHHGPWEYLLPAQHGPGPGPGGTVVLSGLVLQLLLATTLAFSNACVRRSGHFELFYWTHLCYVPVWALLLLHGPNFWKWFAVPGCLFVLELRIVEVDLLPSKVTHPVIKRPPSFRYKPGDCVYLNVPAIAACERHPLSISSAPEQPGSLWLRVRALGRWTSRLHRYFQQLEPLGRRAEPLSGKPRCRRGARVCSAPSSRRLCDVKCYLDGPYGTPTRRIFSSEHAELIGAGIGITPFASTLQSIMYRYRVGKQSCPRRGHSRCQGPKDEAVALRKVDFIRISRDQQHFEWLVSLLAKLEREQAEGEPGGRFLEMHLYVTAALGKNDVKAVGLRGKGGDERPGRLRPARSSARPARGGVGTVLGATSGGLRAWVALHVGVQGVGVLDPRGVEGAGVLEHFGVEEGV